MSAQAFHIDKAPTLGEIVPSLFGPTHQRHANLVTFQLAGGPVVTERVTSLTRVGWDEWEVVMDTPAIRFAAQITFSRGILGSGTMTIEDKHVVVPATG
ncbi:MAG: hypothetical protein WD850_03525 [Candidatus Spechtbacterales bacterium]